MPPLPTRLPTVMRRTALWWSLLLIAVLALATSAQAQVPDRALRDQTAPDLRVEQTRERDWQGARLTVQQERLLSEAPASERSPAVNLLLGAPAATQSSSSFSPPSGGFDFAEDFQETTFPPAGWARFLTGVGGDPDGSLWTRVRPPGSDNSFAESPSNPGSYTSYLATPRLSPTAGNSTILFKMGQNSTFDYGSTYAVVVSTTSQTDFRAYTAVATWTETTPCPGGTGVPPIRIPAERNCAVDLSAYNGQDIFVAFRHFNNGFGDSFFLDDVLGQALELSPGTSVTFDPAGTCSTTPTRTQDFVVTNAAPGTLVVGGASTAGSSAFTVTAAPSFPVSLGYGESTTLTVTFAPGTTAGALTGSLVVTYNNGTAQTSTTALSGTGTGANGTVSVGAGLAVAFAGCGTARPRPALDFINPVAAGHARVAFPYLRTDFTVNLATTYPGVFESIRLMGRNQPTAYISAYGILSFNEQVLNYRGGLPTGRASSSPLGEPMIQVGAMDVDFDPAVYASDNAGVAGLPGVFYGLSDVDGDGRQDLVVTYYHAYDYLSPPITNPAARYVTSQLIVYKAARPNQDDTFEIRYPAGNDANGVPYSQNLTSGGNPTIQNDIAIGIGDATGQEAAIYLNGAGVGGPLTGLGSLAISFEPQTQATASGAAGYRLMGVPIVGNYPSYDVARLAELNLVQGVTGQYPTAGTNLFTGYNGVSFTPATNVTNVLTPGRGFLWYLYDQDTTPSVPPNPANPGTSQSYSLPMPLQATGAGWIFNWDVPLTTTGDKFSMVANPYRESLDVSPATVAAWPGGSGLASAVAQTWDPTAGSSGSYTLLPDNVASAWQGFFLENNTSTMLSIVRSARTTGGTFVGRSAAPATLAFELAGTDAATGAATLDLAATLAVDDALGTDGWDLLDATKLSPLVSAYATIGFQGTRLDGGAVVKAQESRAPDAASFSVPMVVEAVGTAPTLRLSWRGIDTLPATWRLQLSDLVTGTIVDLRSVTSYTFEQASDAVTVLAPEVLLARTTAAAQAKATAEPRFVLQVERGGVVANEPGAPAAFALAAPAPNPMSVLATIAFDVPEASPVYVAVYDLLGRRVAVLAQGEVAAGRHTAPLDAGRFAPGVYVVRMQAGAFTATERVTVVR